MTVKQVQITARNHYLAMPDPLPLNGAIAICAVLYRESGLRPGSQGVQPSEHGGVLNPNGAFGIASWNGPRQGALKDFCDARGLPYNTIEPQLDFVLHEMANSYRLSWAAVRSAAPVASIIRTIVEDYESPKAPEPEIADAIKIATELAAVPLPAPKPPGQLPQVPPARPGLPPAIPELPPVSSGAAGRIAAMAEFLHKGRDARIAELLAGDPEIQWYDATLATLGNVQPATLPSPALPPPADTATTKGTKQVPSSPALPSFMINWKTTLSGAVTLLAQLAQVIPALQPYSDILNKISMLAAGSTGFFAKDNNVTGGTKSNVTGESGAPVSLIS